MGQDRSKSFKCIICGNGEQPRLVQEKVLGDVHGALTVVECACCFHVQLNPPSYSLEFYNEDEQVNFVVHNYGTPIEKLVEHSWIEAHRRVKRFARHRVPLAQTGTTFRVLDVGGGYGFFGSAMKSHDPTMDVVVMEPSAKRAAMGQSYLAERSLTHAMPNFEVKLIDDTYVDANRGRYDLVTMWHVLEHVEDPVGFIRQAAQLVKPGTGALCIEVPNYNDELKTLSSAFRDRCFMIEHISYFSPSMLESLAHKACLGAVVDVYGYQRYGIYNYFNWVAFNKPQGANPDLFEGTDRWWLEATWRAAREQARTSDALFAVIRPAPHS